MNHVVYGVDDLNDPFACGDLVIMLLPEGDYRLVIDREHTTGNCEIKLVPAVENAISNNAYHPGDVITTRKGIIVEMNVTNSEVRLMLCDALTEADGESPDLVINFSAITGYCPVSLGTELPGYLSNNQANALNLIAASSPANDALWQLPLYQPYRTELKSDITGMVNSGSSSSSATIAALY